jgi:hypothetical protein
MRKIDGPFNVANRFEDQDPTNNPNGTVITAQWTNDIQDELINLQAYGGFSEAAGAQSQILKTIRKISREESRLVGEPFYLLEHKPPAIFDPNNIDAYFPAICLDSINGNLTLDVANYPDLVPWLRLRRAIFGAGTGSEASEITVTVSGSTVTFPNTALGNAMILALAEDNLFVGSFTNYRTLNVAGADFPIAGSINPIARTLVVTGTPASGSQTAIIYTNRITGSTTTARLYKADGVALASANDTDQTLISNLFTRDAMQGHWHNTYYQNGTPGAGNTYYAVAQVSSSSLLKTPVNGETQSPTSDGTNGTPRTTKTTRNRSLNGHLYLWARRYLTP